MKTRTNPVKILLIILGIILVIAAVVLSVLIYSGDLRLASLQENVENSYLFGRCSGDVNHVELDETLISVKGMESYKGATAVSYTHLALKDRLIPGFSLEIDCAERGENTRFRSLRIALGASAHKQCCGQ